MLYEPDYHTVSYLTHVLYYSYINRNTTASAGDHRPATAWYSDQFRMLGAWRHSADSTHIRNEATSPPPHQPVQENSTALFCAVTSFGVAMGTTYSDQFCMPGPARCAAN